MNKFNRQLSLFSVLALVAFQNLQATSSNVEEIDSQKSQKSILSQPFEFIQDILQTIKNDPHYSYSYKVPFDHIRNNALDEMKQFQSNMTSDNDMFDYWIILILKTFPKDDNSKDSLKFSIFEDSLKIAIEKGKSEGATPAAQYNLGYIYDQGLSVDISLPDAFKYYKKAADQGFSIAQCHLGDMLYKREGINQDFVQAFKWQKKAADQAEPCAQFYLGYMYMNGQGVDLDLGHSLKWYLKCSEIVNTFPKESTIRYFLLEGLGTFMTFASSPLMIKDEENLVTNQETLKNDIKVLLELHRIEKGINNPDSSFKKHKWTVPSLFESYQKIIDFEMLLLNTIEACHQPGFMINCLKVESQAIETFKLSQSPDIKYYEFQGQSFLTFGQDNIEAANKWMTIFDQSHPVYKAISGILGVLTEIHKSFETEIEMSDVNQALKTQYESRLKSDSDKTSKSDETSDLTLNKKLAEKVEQDIEVLTQLQAIPQKLQDLLIEGTPIRNKLFLQNNDHIEPIFKY